jgi:hypothetical protein
MRLLRLLALFLFMWPVSLHAATYYVATTGNDNNNGTSEGTAWATVAKAANTMVAGDTTYVRGGQYNSNGIRFGVSGTQANPIRLLNYPGERPHIRFNASGNLVAADSIYQIVISSLAGPPNAIGWIEISGFEISNGWGPVKIDAGHHLTFRNNEIHHSLGGYGGHAIDVTIDRNIIRDWGRKASCAAFPPPAVDPAWGYNTCNQDHALYLVGSRWTITNSLIYNGLSYAFHYAGVGFNASVHPTTEYAGARNFYAAGNTVAYQNYGAAIITWQPASQNHTFENNIFYENGVNKNAGDTQGFACQSSGGGHLLRNNIFFASGSGATVVFQANCAGLYTSTNNLTASNPLFVDAGATMPASPNFRLQAGSPAINAGFTAGFFNGSAPDIGAFEDFVHATCSVENATPTVINITYTNNRYPPLLPSTGITGYSARENAGAKTVTSAVRVGDNQVNVTVSAAFSAGTTIDYSWSGGNLTDSAAIGGTQYHSLRAITNQSCTNNVSGASSATLTQTAFRFHDVRGTEAAPVVKPYPGAASNLHITSVPGGKVRLRLKVACTVADCAPLGMALRYSRNGGSYTAVPDSFGADNIRFYGTTEDPSAPLNGTETTELLASSHATNVACAIIRTANAIPTVDLSQNSETECEYAIELDSDAVSTDTYDFRLYDQNGAALSAYSVTPRLTVVPMAAGGGM